MDQQKQCALLTIENKDTSKLHVSISGNLDLYSTSKIWKESFDLLQKNKPNLLILDLNNLIDCDKAGLSLLLELKYRQEKTGKINIINQSDDLKLSLENSSIVIEKKASNCCSLTEKISKQLKHLREDALFIGMFAYQLIKFFKEPKNVYWKNFWQSIEDVGPKALPIIILIGFLVGVITSFQATIPLKQFGAQIFVINLVGITLLKEMGPLMAAILLAGRTASSFAAEIGSMKVNQEIDALTTMGLEPIRFLAIPKILTTTLMTPLLNVFLILSGLLGCGIVMHSMGYGTQIYIEHLRHCVSLQDFISGTIKALVFGIVIGCIGCMYGFRTKLNSTAIGQSTTSAVVSSLVFIVIIDGIFSAIYYVLGI